MNNEQFEMLMTLGHNVVDSMFTFGLVYIGVWSVAGIVTELLIGERR
jgi:hypothetical protein